jgi:hypothetical protein
MRAAFLAGRDAAGRDAKDGDVHGRDAKDGDVHGRDAADSNTGAGE